MTMMWPVSVGNIE